jgi:hypothetical protein
MIDDLSIDLAIELLGHCLNDSTIVPSWCSPSAFAREFGGEESDAASASGSGLT